MAGRGGGGRIAGDVRHPLEGLAPHPPAGSAPARRGLELLGVAALFAALGGAALGPVLLHFGAWLYGITGDAPMTPASIAQRLWAIQRGGLFSPLPYLLGAPFPPYDPGALANPLWWYAATLLALPLGPIGATNAMILQSFVLAGVACYALLRRGGLAPSPALLGALSFAFAPLHLAQAREHPQLLDVGWFALEGLALLALSRRPHWRAGALLGLCLALAELDNPYFAYFGALLAVGWFAGALAWRLGQRRAGAAGRLAGAGALAVAVVIAVVVPTQLRPIAPLASGQPVAPSTLLRDRSEIDSLSLRWWDFLLPPPESPLLGRFGRTTFFAHLGASNATEASTMPGYLALLLALAGLAALAHGRGPPPAADGDDPGRGLAALGLAALVVGVLSGLPSHLPLGPLQVPTPTGPLHALAPEIRTISRSAYLVQLGIAIVGAFGAAALLDRLPTVRRRRILAAAVAALLLLEDADAPPWPHLDLLPMPGVDRWLADLPAASAGIVAQFPLGAVDVAGSPVGEQAFYAYAAHRHPLLAGVAPGSAADALRRALDDPINPAMPAALAGLGVRTATFDTAYYRAAFDERGLRWPGDGGGALAMPAGFRLAYRDAQSAGYAVDAAPAAVLVGQPYASFDEEFRQDGRRWGWIAARDDLIVENTTGRPLPVVLWTLAHNNGGGHTLAWPGYLPVPVSAAGDATPVALALVAPPGVGGLTLEAQGTLAPVPGGAGHPATVELRGLEPAPVRSLDIAFAQAARPRWRLTGVSLDACRIAAGGTLGVALLWRADAPTDGDQTVFLHLVDGRGRLVAQADGPPDGGAAPTAHVQAGAAVSDARAIAVPRALAPGSYRLSAGLYDPRSGRRLTAGGSDTADLGPVEVLPASAGPARVPCGW